MKHILISISSLVLVASMLTSNLIAELQIDTVPVKNAGNPSDTTGYGAVAYEYRIGKTEITNTQYAAFLDAVATRDVVALYTSSMSVSPNGGILRSGAQGSFVYTVKPGMANKPVNFVDFWDAARFANWMHNGQPVGEQTNLTTEDGAYTLTPSVIENDTVIRNANARWFIPSENEWYKAAYHKNNGPTNQYWLYPTQSNSIPYSDQPPGTGAPRSANTVNMFLNDNLANGYNDGYATTGSPFLDNPAAIYLTDVGAYTQAFSAYGTFDQAGNLTELTESQPFPTRLAIRGSDYMNSPLTAASTFLNDVYPDTSNVLIGFRIATVPEPSSIAFIIFAGGALAWKLRPARRFERA